MGAGSPSQQSPCAFFARSVDNRLCSGSWSPTASFLNGARSLSAISANFHPSSSLLTRHVRKRSTVRSPGVELVLFHYLVRLERKLDRARPRTQHQRRLSLAASLRAKTFLRQSSLLRPWFQGPATPSSARRRRRSKVPREDKDRAAASNGTPSLDSNFEARTRAPLRRWTNVEAENRSRAKNSFTHERPFRPRYKTLPCCCLCFPTTQPV